MTAASLDAPVVPAAPEQAAVGLRDVALRDAIRALAQARLQAPPTTGGAGGRRWDDLGAPGSGIDAAVAREVAAFALDAQRRGVGLDEVLVAVAAAVRTSGASLPVGPRESVVRDATRCCVKAYYEARATAGVAAPAEDRSARP